MAIQQEAAAEILSAAFPEFESAMAEHRKDRGNGPMLCLLAAVFFGFADELMPGRKRVCL
jgi:hypothetical protein